MSDTGSGTAVEVGTREPKELAERASDVVVADELLRIALRPGEDGKVAGIEIVERIVALREREQERQAEMAMAEALAGFQAECPEIRRTATADVKKDGRKLYEYHFAPLDEIARVIRPVLAKYGLSYTHDRALDEKMVTVTCTLRHIGGATRTATFTGPIDTSGGKNPIQMVSSAGSYGRRYTLTDVLGLTTGDDDDGKGAGDPPEFVTEKQAADLHCLAEEVGVDVPAFFAWLGVKSWEQIPAARAKDAADALERKRQAKARAAS